MSEILKALALTSLSLGLVLVVATEAGATPTAAHGISTGSLTPQTVEFGGAKDDTPGSVFGRLVEFDSTPLPKILVRLEGPEPEATVRTTVTDDNANFVFVDLAPGTYRFSVELPGVIVSAETIEIPPGTRVTTALILDLFATEVQVTVQASAIETPELFDPTSTAGRQVVATPTMRRLPLRAEQALEVLPLLPNVVRGPKGQISLDGTLPSDSILLFNGIDFTDTFSGQHRLRLPLESVAEVQVYTGVYPATYGQLLGGIVDVSTAPGGDEWGFSVSSFIPRPRFEDGTIMGVNNASPRMRVSGPVGNGGLHLSQSFEYHLDRIKVEDVPGNSGQDHVRIEGWDSLTQFDWYPNNRHHSRFTFLAFPQRDDFVGLDGVTPPETTYNVERDAEGFLGQHKWLIDDRSTLEFSVQYNRVGIASRPQGPAPEEVIPDGVRGNAFHLEDRQTTRGQAVGIYTRSFGGDRPSHVVELGGEVQRLHFSGIYANDTILVRGADDRLLQRIDFINPDALSQDNYEWALFVQDRWSHGYRFWCDVGLRYSSDSATRDPRFEPRIGLAWDPVGNGKTLLKAGAGLLYRRIYLGELVWEEFPIRVETTFEDDGATVGVFFPRLPEDLSAPWSVIGSLELSHRFGSDLLVRTAYRQRESRDQIIIDRVEPGGYELAPGGDPLAPSVLRSEEAKGSLLLHADGESSSWSLEFTANQRMPRDGEIFVSYVYSSAEGDLNDFSIVGGELPDPIIRPNRRGKLRFDAPHRVLVWGTLNLPWGLIVAPVIEWRSGFPYSVLKEDQSYLGPANSERFPSFVAIDAAVTKDVTVGKYKLRVGAKLTNLTGHFNPRNVIPNVASPRFGEFLNSVPIRLRARLSVDF